MVVKQFVDHAYAHVLATGRPLDRRVLDHHRRARQHRPDPQPRRHRLDRRLAGPAAGVDRAGPLAAPQPIRRRRRRHHRQQPPGAAAAVGGQGRRHPRAGLQAARHPRTARSTSTSRDGWGRRTRTESSTRCRPGADRGPPPTTPRYGHPDLRQPARRRADAAAMVQPPAPRRRARYLPAGTGPLNPLPLDREERRAS